MEYLTYALGLEIVRQRQQNLVRYAPPRREKKHRRLSFTLRRPAAAPVPCPTC